VIAKAEHIVAIPGTTRIEHLRENLGAAALRPPQEALARIERLINQRTVTGARYSEAAQADIDTEEF
jgi:aryl-alcohol dehydrogenase-like predicted oxidoreductase